MADPVSHSPDAGCELLQIDREEVYSQIRAAVARRRERTGSGVSTSRLRRTGPAPLLLQQYLRKRPVTGDKRNWLAAFIRWPIDLVIRQIRRVVNACTLPLQLTILDHLWQLGHSIDQLRCSLHTQQQKQSPEALEPRRKSA
jgi:hypothetical protein